MRDAVFSPAATENAIAETRGRYPERACDAGREGNWRSTRNPENPRFVAIRTGRRRLFSWSCDDFYSFSDAIKIFVDGLPNLRFMALIRGEHSRFPAKASMEKGAVESNELRKYVETARHLRFALAAAEAARHEKREAAKGCWRSWNSGTIGKSGKGS